MLKYTLSRLLHLMPVLLPVSGLAFAMIRFLPGNGLDILAGAEQVSDPQIRAAFQREYGLDQPRYVQYLRWFGHVLHGNCGRSMVTRRPIATEFFERIAATRYLACVSIAVSLLLAIPLDTIVAVRRNTLTDSVAQTTSLCGISSPACWCAMMAVLVFSLYLRWLPSPAYDSPLGNLSKSLTHLILPNGLSPVIVQATVYRGLTILVITALAFLDLGAPPPTPDWGYDLNLARDHRETPPSSAYSRAWPSQTRCWRSTCTAMGYGLFWNPRLTEG